MRSLEQYWKILIALTLCIVALFDFAVYPTWTDAVRLSVAELEELLRDKDPSVQLALIHTLYREYNPYSLRGAGLFYLCMGGILSGAAIFEYKKPTKPKEDSAE